MRATRPQSLIPNRELNADVRRHDEDRWLASRFAPPDVRASLIAIYALNYEIARTAEVVTQPAIGDIRLAWWAEALEEIAAGKSPRAHPTLDAAASVLRAAPQTLSLWRRLIAARGKDLDAAPFANWSEVEDYLDAAAGGVMRIALVACGVDPNQYTPFIAAAAQAWGATGLLRAEPHWRARGRAAIPRAGGVRDDLVAHAHIALAQTRTHSRTLPEAAFPALGYVKLAGAYLRAYERGGPPPPLLARQLELVLASATGRF